MGTVKSNITEKVILPGNRRVKIPAIICNQMITDESLVMYSLTSSSSYGKSVEITPTVTNLMKEEHKHVTVEMINMTLEPIIIQPRAILCELQKVEAVEKGNPVDSQ